MRQLFKIDDEGDVKLQDDTFLLIPELKEVYDSSELGSKAIRWIVLVYDYKSPYRQLTLSARIEEATQDIYQKKKVKELNCGLMQDAIKKYNKLQFDPLRDQYRVYTDKIAEYNEYISKMGLRSDTAKELQDLMINSEKVIKARENLKEMIIKKEDEERIHGGGEASLLEELME
jgi:hypothetical protein